MTNQKKIVYIYIYIIRQTNKYIIYIMCITNYMLCVCVCVCVWTSQVAR